MSSGGPGRSENRSWRAPGASQRRPRGSKLRFGEGKRRPRESKKDFEAILGPKTTVGNFFWRRFWEPWGGLGGALGRLGAAFLSDLVAHSFFVHFSSILGRFGDGFLYQIHRKNGYKTKLILNSFLMFFHDFWIHLRKSWIYGKVCFSQGKTMFFEVQRIHFIMFFVYFFIIFRRRFGDRFLMHF